MSGVSVDPKEKRQSERELVSLEEFFDNAAIGLHIVGEDGTILRANKYELELLGYTAEEYVGRKVSEFHADERAIADILERLSRNQTIKEYPARLKCKNGKIKNVLITSNVYWRDGKFVHTRCFTREAAPALREQVLDQLFAESHSFMTILSVPEFRYLKSNEQHSKLLRKKESEILGKTVSELLPELQAQGITALLKEVVRTGERFVAKEARVEFGSGDTRWTTYLDFVYQPLKDAADAVYAIAAQGYDVTEKVLARQRIENAEQELRNLANVMPNLAWMANPDGHITWYNDRWYEYTGTTPEQMAGWGWQSVHDQNLLPKVIDEWKTSLATGQLFEMTFPLRGKDGAFRWFLTRVQPLKNESGAVTRWFGTNTDVTTERANAQKLKITSDALENSLNGFDIVDDQGKLIYVNKSYVKMWGFDSADEILGTSPASHCLDPNVPLQIISKLKSTGQCDIEFVAKRKDGSTFDARMLAFLARDFDGREIYPTTSIDITKQKQALAALTKSERELSAAKDEAERANELKSAFLANMSHEIRTPLGAMIGFADLLRDPGLSAVERSSYIDILSRNGQSLSVIINDILDLSKVEAGHLTLEFTNTNPEQIAADVISLLRVKANEKDLRLVLDTDETLPETIVTDPNRLKQILFNLVGNAIKFTQFGSVHLKAYGCKTASGRAAACFEIIDSGIGIPESQKERVFEMFVQADGSMARRFGGTGLGLALSRRLSRALGGDVEITQTAEGKGSTFLVKIEDQPARKNTDTTLKHEENFRSEPAPDALSGVRVLVVDDSPDNQKLIWHYLTKRGAVVETAENGLMGYRKALLGEHDIVLMDIQMPEMDGYTATYKLRSAGYRKPIIALTAHVLSDVREKCLNVGCSGHLPKPINPAQLIMTIAEMTR